MGYIPLDQLEIYQLSRTQSTEAWNIYITLEKNLQFSIGNQWIRSVDSIGANIAEGYRRFQAKDKIRFYYIARASLSESRHWLALLQERSLINTNTYNTLRNTFILLDKKLNTFISAQKDRT